MPVARFEMPDGRVARFEVPDGTTPEQAQSMFDAYMASTGTPRQEEGFGAKLSRNLSDIPRQLGLTARHGIQGAADVVDMLTAPVYAGLNLAGANLDTPSALGRRAADAIGLPEPATQTERVVGEASRVLAGGGGMVGAAGRMAQLPGTAGKVMTAMAANPGSQMAGAAGSGMAGGYVKETGGGPGAQLVAALAGGVAGGTVAPILGRFKQSLANAIAEFKPGRANDMAQRVDIVITNALAENGIRLDELPREILTGLRGDVARALNIGDGELSPDAVRRLADYRQAGLAPTRAGLTLDPADVTRQKNLAKIGANSEDPAMQSLARIENQNNKELIEGLNRAGAGAADDALGTGQAAIGALERLTTRVKSATGAKYDAARAANGRSAQLDPSAFTQRASDMLDEALLGSKLPDDVRGLLNKIAGDQMPFTVNVAEQLKTRIGDLQRGSTEPSVRKALGMVRQALDETPLLPGQDIGQEAIDAFNAARSQHRKWMKVVDATPALKAVSEGVEPDRFVNDFIVGNGKNANVSAVMRLASALKTDKDAKQQVKYYLASWLKDKAMNGASDEVGTFSQSGYNKAMKQLGDAKLKLFFSKAELDQLKVIGRVASYEQVQPKGAAVNNSNTATTLISSFVERLGNSGLLKKIPLGAELIGKPAYHISVGAQAKRAANVPNALIRKQQRPTGSSPMLLVAPALQLGSEP